MSETMRDLPDLDEPYALSEDQIAAYRRDGHVLVRGLVNLDEMAAYRPVIRDYVRRHNKQTTPLEKRDTYHRAFLQLANLWENDASVAKFTMARRFAGVAAELMGVEAVRLYHDQALFKEPGGGHTPWHQDQYYWPLDTTHTVTMWMPLVEVTDQMGAITFASGSHKEGSFCSLAISDESEAVLRRVVEQRGFPIEGRAVGAGDATFHSGWTLHMAPPNHSKQMREVMTIIYYADGTRLLEPANADQPADLARWFPGQKPGEFAGGELTPLLYKRSS